MLNSATQENGIYRLVNVDKKFYITLPIKYLYPKLSQSFFYILDKIDKIIQ